MAETSHPIKDIALTIAYPDKGKDSGYAVIHARGCSHTLRRTLYGAPVDIDRRPHPEDPYADDYYAVAPCARAKDWT